jgi:cell wall integrity and stress response component
MIQTVTLDGTIKTVTVVPEPTGFSDSDENHNGTSQTSGGGGLGGGAIAGIVIGTLAGIGLIALAFFLIRRRQRKQSSESAYQDDPSVRDNSADGVGGHNPEMSMSNRSGGTPGSPNSASNRDSRLVDPRMNPFKTPGYRGNVSSESVNTIRDDQDYSRRIQPPKVLRATNPDPEMD